LEFGPPKRFQVTIQLRDLSKAANLYPPVAALEMAALETAPPGPAEGFWH
jgi:hypothetical protein